MKHALKVMVLLGMLTGCAGESAEVGRGDRPVRPSVPDDGTDTGELVFRLSDLGFVTTGSNVGRNLDGLDTTVADRAAECSAPSAACTRLAFTSSERSAQWWPVTSKRARSCSRLPWVARSPRS